MKLFVLMGLLGLMMKGYRVIYIIISLEMMMMGVIIYLSPEVSEVLFFLLLTYAVLSSVMGLLVIVSMITSYGSDYVKF